MNKQKHHLDKINRIVSPMDSMIRAVIGVIIMICCYTLPIGIVEFLFWHMGICYFWLTGLTGWDPFYTVYLKFWRNLRDKLAIEGRFK